MDRFKATARIMCFVIFCIVAFLLHYAIPGPMPWFFWVLIGYAGGMITYKDGEDVCDKSS